MTAYDILQKKLVQLTDIRGAVSVMIWDQEVMMPEGGAALRARQIATMNGLIHSMFVTEVDPLLTAAEAELDGLSEVQKNNLKQLRKDVDERKKVPVAFVEKISQATGDCFQAWRKAKEADDYSIYEPFLTNLIALKKEEAAYLGFESNPYDALLNTFEPGATSAQVRTLFDGFKKELGKLLDEIKARPQQEVDFLQVAIPEDAQLAFGKHLLQSIGYDFHYGRQDLAMHPFMIAMNPEDVRVTTRVEETNIEMMMYSSLHEGGHAMYERGLQVAEYGMPAGEACSLAIHESQSRLIENNVSRSIAFLQLHFDKFRELFPDKLAGKTVTDVYKAYNRVGPSLIRISADELTYHFHVILRFELEDDLMNDRLTVKDLPAAWNAKIKEYLGLDVPSDAQGVLQDIHWSHGSIGYFPTYSLGSFYAAQFMAAAKKAHPQLEAEIQAGNFSSLHNWLKENVYQHGRQFTAEELCKKATGEPLNVNYFITYAREKFGEVYGL